MPKDEPDQLRRGGQIDQVLDAVGRVVVDPEWNATRVTGVTRGSGADAISVTISGQPEGPWTVTEGSEVTSTRSEYSLTEHGDGWLQTVTVPPPAGHGQPLQSTVQIDRDGRALSSTDPAGVETTTTYMSGIGAQRFAPDVVTVEAGGMTLTTDYDYWNGTTLPVSISRTGPQGMLTTTISRDASGNPHTTTAPDQTTTSQTFDAVGRMTSSTASSGGSTSIVDFQPSSGEPVVVQSAAGDGLTTTTLSRDQRGFVTSTNVAMTSDEHPEGSDHFHTRSSTSEVNALGWTLSSTSGGATSETAYDASGRIGSIVSQSSGPDGQPNPITTTPSYTSAGLIGAIHRTQGSTTETSTMGYDSGGRLLTSSTAGLTTSYAYDTGGRTVTRTEDVGAGLTTSYEYDEAGRLLRTTSPGGKTWEYRYDALGRRVGSVDPSSICEAVELTVDGRVSARRWRDGADCEAGPLWAWEEYAYDAVGRQTATTAHRFGHGDPQGLPAAMEPPDDDHQLSSTTEYWELTDPAQGAVTGLVQLIRDPLGRETRFFYDEAGREQRRLLPDGTEIVTQYYPDGKVHLRTVQHTGGDEPWSLTTETRYDDQGRVRQVIEPDGSTTSSFYDELGRKVSTDRAGRVTTWRYSADGREVTETRPDQASITRRYDERGNLVEYADHENNLTTYAYDDLGRLTDIFYPSETPGQSEVDPSRHITYTADGEVQTITRANGEVVTFHYEEPTGRLQWVDVDGTEVARYTYDAMGRVLTAMTPDTTLAFTWDSLGQQLSEELGIDEQIAAGFGTHTVERRFDDGGRVYAVGETGAVLHRAWDSGDRLVGLDPGATWPTALPAPDADLSGWAWRATQAGQRLLAVERGNGLTTRREYRSDGLPTEITTGVAIDGEITDPIHRLGLGWNADRLRASKSRADLNQKVLSFHYDGAGHLESASPTPPFAIAETDHDLNALLDGIPDAPAQPWILTEDWHVSAVDELVKRRRRTEGRVEALDPTYNHLHQLEATGDGTTYTWSADGNLESKIVEAQDGTVLEQTSYTHDWRDRLVQVVLDHQSATHDIVLDALGRMVAKRVTGPGVDRTRVYLHDGDQVIAEYVTAPGGGMHLERRHHWAQWIDDLAIEQVDTDADGALDATLWPIADLLGSVQLLTDEDGRIVEHIAYGSDGTPHFYSEDTAPPEVVRVAWRAADATLHLGLSEVVDSERAEGIVATLGGDALAVELAPGGRGLVLSAATPTAGVAEALQLSGVYDRTGNQLIDTVSLTLADPAADESLIDTRAPEVLAVIEEADGLVVVFDEPVEPADGVALEDALGVVRTSSTPVTTIVGTTTQLAPEVLRWTANDGQPWSLGSTYHLAEAQLVDTAGRDVDVHTTFVHEIMADDEALVVYSAPSEGEVRGSSAWGVTTLFQGREWHRDLGLYYFRARWVAEKAGGFVERDPLRYRDSPNLYQALGWDIFNSVDPSGMWSIIARVYNKCDSTAPPPNNPTCLAPWTTVRLFEADATLRLGPYYGLARGSRRVPHPHGTAANRQTTDGDTPFGVYLSKDAKHGHRMQTRDETEVKSTYRGNKRTPPEAYGSGQVIFHPLFLETGTAGRSLIRIHGGGTYAARPFDPDQRLTNTLGCIRLKNRDITELVAGIRSIVGTGDEMGIIVIGDSDFLYWLALSAKSPLRALWMREGITSKTSVRYRVLQLLLVLQSDAPIRGYAATALRPEGVSDDFFNRFVQTITRRSQ